MAIAMSVLVHGEAVRFNRGKSSRDDYDFKYLRGANGEVYPYVSSQCYKKHWREALSTQPSPIYRGKSSGGKGENQAYTDGNPIDYADDDLFGYMVAGAEDSGSESTTENVESEGEGAVIDPKVAAFLFDVDDLKDVKALITKLRNADDELSRFIVERMKPEAQIELEAVSEGHAVSTTLQQGIVEALNDCLQERNLYSEARFPQVKLKPPQRKIMESRDSDFVKVVEVNRGLLQSVFKKEIEEKKKRETTRRTAPIRMHALVAFSGIKRAKDWQIFARDVAYTGRDAVINPSVVGIYSGWLKTRVIIETERIGKFYVGRNMDILDAQQRELELHKEANPYSRHQEQVRYILLSPEQRKERLRDAIQALANIGNSRGPASGALHDGSLRPRAFIAAHMKCADSPFDSIWEGTNDLPHFNLPRLKTVLADWDDLFASKVIYIGLPVEEGDAESIRQDIEKELKDSGFTLHIGTPRKMLLKLSEEASL
jgi:hypothetical protein